jgi:hypothetical protein
MSMLKCGKTDDDGSGHLNYDGCSCHNTPKTRRKAAHSIKRKGEKAWKKTEKTAY